VGAVCIHQDGKNIQVSEFWFIWLRRDYTPNIYIYAAHAHKSL